VSLSCALPEFHFLFSSSLFRSFALFGSFKKSKYEGLVPSLFKKRAMRSSPLPSLFYKRATWSSSLPRSCSFALYKKSDSETGSLQKSKRPAHSLKKSKRIKDKNIKEKRVNCSLKRAKEQSPMKIYLY